MIDARLQNFIEWMVLSDDLQNAVAQVDQWAEAAETTLLRDLVIDLQTTGVARGLDPEVVDYICGRVTQALVRTHGQRQLELVLALSTLHMEVREDLLTPPHRRTARAASLLASGLGKFLLVKMFEKYAWDERYYALFSLVLHEMVMRGCPCSQEDALIEHAERMKKRHHPLALLPLERTSIESAVSPTEHGRSAFHKPLLQRSAGASSGSGNQPPGEVERPQEIEVPSRASTEIRLPFTDWQTRSETRLELRLFQYREPLAAERLTPFHLLQLGLHCLTETDESTISLAPIGAGDAFARLFAAASDGEWFPGGGFAAEGRLKAWRAIAALAATSLENGTAPAEAKVLECAYFTFHAQNDWFHLPESDVGFVVLRNGGRELVVLAASHGL